MTGTRMWHTQDSHGQILALIFRLKSLERSKLLPSCSETDDDGYPNVAHTRQSRPDSGLGFQVKVLKTFIMLFPFRSEADDDKYQNMAHIRQSRPDYGLGFQ